MTKEQIILDTYWPVIEKAIAVQAFYNGRKDGVKKICADVVGELIEELIKARKALPIERTEVK